MKILKLRFRNLNSLYGEWLIDFTDPEYSSSGIFVLAGPTGAGKSTVLDAISLALYGITPRLGLISKGENEIISRRTGECYAEVEFSTQSGSFLAHWEQRRARGLRDGILQAPRHEIVDLSTGKLIESKKSLVAGVVEEKTGMDYRRFTRSILLAQGGFDSLLKAEAEEKSKILEQITGTGIYSEISQRVHGRNREERERLALLAAELEGIGELKPHEEEELRQELQKMESEGEECLKERESAEEKLAWLIGVGKLREELLSLSGEERALQSEVDEFSEDDARLNLALTAAQLEVKHSSLVEARRQQATDADSLKREESGLPGLEGELSLLRKEVDSVEEKVKQEKEELSRSAPLFRQVEELDFGISEHDTRLGKLRDEYGEVAESMDTQHQAQAVTKERLLEYQDELASIDNYLKENDGDRILVAELTGITEQLIGLTSRKGEIADCEHRVEEAGTALQGACNRLEDLGCKSSSSKEDLVRVEEHFEEAREEYDRLLDGGTLREYRLEKEGLQREQHLLEKIHSLEEHRAKLQAGEPCPLCGSEEHPFAGGSVPVVDDIGVKVERVSRLIELAERQGEAIAVLEKNRSECRERLVECEKEEALATRDREAARSDLAAAEHALSAMREEFRASGEKCLSRLLPFGIREIPEGSIEELLDALGNRKTMWQQQEQKRGEIERELVRLTGEIKHIDGSISTHKEELGKREHALKEEESRGAEMRTRRRELYGDRKPSVEEQEMQARIDRLELREREIRSSYQDSAQRLNSATARIGSLKERMGERGAELDRLESVFLLSLEEAGFIDEGQFLDATLSAGDRDSLLARRGVLEKRRIEIGARLQDRRERLKQEESKRLTEDTVEVCDGKCRELRERHERLTHASVALKHRIEGIEATRERIGEKRVVMEAQRRECARWEKLDRLIGSSDGKKFRAFAQGVTFEALVAQANHRLQKMTDRYLLLRDDARPLELNVIDNYQAGEVRSTRNLSGGESFIVSLALALGLSKMASRRVSVDSLFLDEGFGTLDEDSLETALDTLSGLQQEGNLIGVISHVPALKERIRTQISITPVAGGRSTIAGPGCRRLKEE